MTQPDDPADTRMMGIVHSALRRDLVRARLVLAEPTPLTGERRTALADHVRWLMDFLHHHHTNEDDGLYPLVLEKNPAAGELLAVMDADHHRITPRILELDVAARSYRAGKDGSDAALLAALEGPGDRHVPAPRARGAGDDAGGLGVDHEPRVAGLGGRLQQDEVA